MKEFENLFSIEEAQKENILLSGANGSGKTRLACGLANFFRMNGFQVLAFDTSGAWKENSDIPRFNLVRVSENGFDYREPQEESLIYDLSRLNLKQARAFVNEVLGLLWNKRVEHGKRNAKLMLFFEEAETYLSNIRGSEDSEVYRCLHVGRNLNERAVLITTDLALLDASAIRLCSIRFHGKLNIEENSKRKFRAYYGTDNARIAFEGLKCGDFLRLQNGKLDVVSLPCFHTNIKSEPLLNWNLEKLALMRQPKPSLLFKLSKTIESLTFPFC